MATSRSAVRRASNFAFFANQQTGFGAHFLRQHRVGIYVLLVIYPRNVGTRIPLRTKRPPRRWISARLEELPLEYLMTNEYQTGDAVPQSGVYRVRHDRAH